jgi:hypothetical protein
MKEIRNLQANNPNFAHTEHEWILEDITNLQHYSSTNLETWLYEAKNLSGINQQKLKLQLKNNSGQQFWKSARKKPVIKPIEKSELDPGESQNCYLVDC